MPRLVIIALDGFPHRAISPSLTPAMWAFAAAGGRAPEGGITDLPSSTDPGFCSLLTGCHPATHGVRTTSWRYAKLPSWAGSERPQVPSIFDLARRVGIGSTAVVADDRGLLATDAADLRWPPNGVIPPGTALDAHGYPLNREVLPRLRDALARPDLDLVFGHFNESDTVGHDHGPESDAAWECYSATDAVVGQVLEALAARWDETVAVIVSDHDMQARDGSEPIDLMAVADGKWDLFVPDGGAALVHLCDGVDGAAAGDALVEVDGVESWQPGGPSMLIAGATPGRIFSAPRYPAGGFHGAPLTARTVALVGGGHPLVRRVGEALQVRRPHLADWAPTLAPLLHLHLAGADGANFLP
ncbi:MAG TPA: alkaline phosphatase family protein [Candidatus Dormibacteraeota bacterium]